MMGALDIVQVPGYPGMWARRCVVDAWVAAGSPALDGAGRTYEKQKWFWRLYNTIINGVRQGNAADNPDADTRQPHVRGMAFDLAWRNPPDAVIERMEAQGFIRPITVRKGKPWKDGKGGFSQDEAWHFELAEFFAGVKKIAKVTDSMAAKALPYVAPAGGGASTFDPTKPTEEDDMGFAYMTDEKKPYYWFSFARGKSRKLSSKEVVQMRSAERSGIPGNEIHKVAAGWYENQLKLGTYEPV